MDFKKPKRVQSFDKPSVWLEFSPLASLTNSLNLGQGFPDWAPPKFLQEISKKTITGNEFSSYARSAGHLNLVKSISDNYSEKLKHKIDAKEEVLVTVGASQAIYLSIMALIDKGDEVIVIEPAFDLYYGALAMAEAIVKPVPLNLDSTNSDSSSQFKLDWNCLRKQLSSSTKAIILNSPHNPSGKVFNQDELNQLIEILKSYPDCLIISDEVYEHIIYDNSVHIPIASQKNMFERTISIYSAGKTFAVTGWKIGWIIGPRKIIRLLQLTQQWVVFSVSTPHQEAIAQALNLANTPYNQYENYYAWLKEHYTQKRNLLYKGLQKAGLKPILPEGSFFILSRIEVTPNYLSPKNKIMYNKLIGEKKIVSDPSTILSNDYNFCRQLSLENNVTPIPMSAFYSKQNKMLGENKVRFAFCKSDEMLLQAIKNLA